jgi:hypothetical protein
MVGYYSMVYTLCKLRDCGLVQNSGKLTDYPELNMAQSVTVIKSLLNILNTQSLADYIELNMSSGRSMMKPFPDCIVYQLAAKMKDHDNQ